MNDTVTEFPRIYVACLAAYNQGILHGAWIDAGQDLGAMWRELWAMLAGSPVADAEEWAIHDYEGFGELRLSEWQSIATVHAMACFIVEHGDVGQAVLAHFSGDLGEAATALENYRGRYDSLADFAAEVTEETTEVPRALAHYIDYAAMGRDMDLNGDIFTIEADGMAVHVFWSH